MKAKIDILKTYSIGTKIARKKKSISKRLLKISFNFELSKVHNYHLVYLFIYKKFTLHFIISPFKAYLVIINNLEWKII
jgi:hypothetical protein